MRGGGWGRVRHVIATFSPREEAGKRESERHTPPYDDVEDEGELELVLADNLDEREGGALRGSSLVGGCGSIHSHRPDARVGRGAGSGARLHDQGHSRHEGGRHG